jgi:integrase
MSKKNQLTTSDHLKFEEYQRLLAALHKDKKYFWEMFAVLSFCTACRVSDVLRFRWCDVLNAKQCTVCEKKTSKSRMIPFNMEVATKFRQLYRLMGEPDKSGYIFSNKGDKPITVQFINRKLKEFKDIYELDIDNFSTHTFRKTFGRYVYDQNNHSAESLLLLNQILNHSNLNVTKRYIGITAEEIGNVFQSINLCWK